VQAVVDSGSDFRFLARRLSVLNGDCLVKYCSRYPGGLVKVASQQSSVTWDCCVFKREMEMKRAYFGCWLVMVFCVQANAQENGQEAGQVAGSDAGRHTVAGSLQAAADVPLRHWPQWRGPDWNGVANKGNPPINWSSAENLRWKVPLPGRGHGTPIIWGDRMILQAAIPLDQPLRVPDVIPPGTPNVTVNPEESTVSWKAQQLVLVCLDRLSGKQLWIRTVHQSMPHQGHHLKGTFAAQSSVTDGKHVYAYFGSYGLYCFDLEGTLVWKQDAQPQAMEAGLGEGSSPALFENTLVIAVDQESQSYVVALDKRTGKEIWRQDRDEPSNWSTPRIFTYEGRTQVVVHGITVRSYDLATGQLLWSYGGHTASAIPMPAIGHGMVFTVSGWRQDALHAVRLGGAGDLTESESVVWSLNRGTPYVPCPTLWGQELYLLEDRSFFSCYNAVDGKQHFRERLPGTANFSASPVAVGDRIYLASEEGNTYVVRRGTEFEVLAINALDDSFHASPVIIGNAIYLRGKLHLYCFENQTQ